MNISKVVVFQTFSFCFWLKLFNRNLTLIYHIGNHELSKSKEYFNYYIIHDELAKKILPKINWIVSVSDYIKKGIIARFPAVQDKCISIYPGIDLDIFKSKWTDKCKDTKTIIYTGRIVPEKGVHVLVEAFKLLKAKCPDAKLQIVGMLLGPNGDENYLEGLKDVDIDILDLCPRRQIASILKSATAFVYPVVWEEALGLAPLEAMAVGVPVIVSDVASGYSEIINNRNGYYFSKDNSGELAEILAEIIDDEDKQKEMGVAARETIRERLSWEKCITKTVELLEKKK